VKEAEEAVIRGIIADKMDIKGGYAKPHWTDVLWVQLAILPLTVYRWSRFYLVWLWRFGIRREEYGREEQLYVIRKSLGISQGQFGQLEEDEVEEMLEGELWIKENFTVWKEEKDAEKRIKMAQSGRYSS
jgi:DnaJ family protein C protein 25